ncbi:MAG: hypothetical protein IPJ20_16845 [Flammeovirgaceae bacterium]|nr:hypothetical protein [Flammeovirgaceae bacterium]
MAGIRLTRLQKYCESMLAKAIYDLEQNQLDLKMVSPLDQQIAYLGPECHSV